MIKQNSIELTGIAEEPFPIIEIRDAFEHLNVGGLLTIVVPHRDMHFGGSVLGPHDRHKCFYLPENCEPPHTFSLKHVIQEALKSIASEVPAGFEGLNEKQREALAEAAEGQSVWKMTLHIDQNHIIAVVTKMSAYFLVE